MMLCANVRFLWLFRRAFFIHCPRPFDFSEKAFLLPRDLLWKAYVDQWLHQTVASGTFDKILEQWLAYPWPQTIAR